MLSGDGFFEPRVPQPPIRTRPQLHHPTSIYFLCTSSVLPLYFHLLPFTSSALPFTSSVLPFTSTVLPFTSIYFHLHPYTTILNFISSVLLFAKNIFTSAARAARLPQTATNCHGLLGACSSHAYDACDAHFATDS